jgi:hypothetical protein
MRLTRRDALATLTGAGIVGGGATAVLAREGDGGGGGGESVDDPLDEETRRSLVHTAEVLYPSAVEGTESFVRTYADGKAAERPAFRDGATEATDTLMEYAETWERRAYTDLSVAERDDLLRRMGVHTADPVPDGTDPERVRFHVVNELLYALYSSPTGGELVGIESPQGHPGGTESYRHGPATTGGRGDDR